MPIPPGFNPNIFTTDQYYRLILELEQEIDRRGVHATLKAMDADATREKRSRIEREIATADEVYRAWLEAQVVECVEVLYPNGERVWEVARDYRRNPAPGSACIR